jgi:hypothetical protein
MVNATKKNNDWGLNLFLPTLPSFIREVHRGCGGIEESTRRKKTEKNSGVYIFFNIFSIYLF